jgi:hypothetical protein
MDEQLKAIPDPAAVAAVERVLRAIVETGKKLVEQGLAIQVLATETAQLRQTVQLLTEAVKGHNKIFREMAKAGGVDIDATVN